MRPTHRRTTFRRAAAWRASLVVAALGAATTLPSLTVAADLPGIDGVMIHGPLGSRTGVQVPDPAVPPDPADIAPFDTYGRDPALSVWFVSDPDAGEGWVAWQVLAVPAADPAAEPRSLATDVAEAPVDRVDLAPPAPGDWLVTAALQAGSGGPEGTWAWHLVVPDRAIPESIAAPDLVLFGGGETIVAERGSGCYLGTCGDVGGIPRAGLLPAVRLERSDEPIALTLSDGSGMATVSVSAEPLEVDESEPVVLLDALDVAGGTFVHVPPPPSAGDWRLHVFVRFSDGRGDQAGYARVVVPRS